MASHRYVAIVEKAGENYSAYLPDVPGCVATGRTVEETVRSLRQALAFHLQGLAEDGLSAPLPLTHTLRIDADSDCAVA